VPTEVDEPALAEGVAVRPAAVGLAPASAAVAASRVNNSVPKPSWS
jgi:hypothetical protein